MEIRKVPKKIIEIIKKYRYAIVVLIIGLVLILIPNTDQSDTNEETSVPQTINTDTTQEELKHILSKIDGAGSVEVMLTVAEGEEIIYQENKDLSNEDNSTDSKFDTVTVTDAQRNQTGLIRKINPPKYLGVIVLCQGADDPVVKLAIVDAVSKITGLGTNCISVLKMK